jgi:hypothetical protein
MAAFRGGINFYDNTLLLNKTTGRLNIELEHQLIQNPRVQRPNPRL